MAIQSEHATARDLAQSLFATVTLAIEAEPDANTPESVDRLSEFEWIEPAANSKCLYARDLRTGQLFRIVAKPVKSVSDGD